MQISSDKPVKSEKPEKPEKPEIEPSAWPLQESVQFLTWVAQTFDYDASTTATGSTDDAEEEEDVQRVLFSQQRFVRDYLQEASPYRGLLLYHSLGVGKTCAAIAAAEVLRPTRDGKIFVMVTKMLRGNFADEIPSCTSPELARKQRWARVAKNDARVLHLTKKIPAAVLRKHNGQVWYPEFSHLNNEAGQLAGPSNNGEDEALRFEDYDELDLTSQAQVDAQIAAVISATFRFLHYNGMTQASIHALLDGPVNPFDDSVIIIDEVHNFISRVMNEKLILPVYEKLLDANNCKIILLSGTPIVNRVAELGYLVNLVQGRALIHEIVLKKDVTRDVIQSLLERSNDVMRRIRQLSFDSTTRIVRLTFLPTGFENAEDSRDSRDSRESGGGASVTTTPMFIRRPSQDTSPSSGVDVIELVKDIFIRAGLRPSEHRVLAALPLPDTVEDFDKYFVDEQNGTLLNPILLQRRIMGAISTYRKQTIDLFATCSPIEVVHVTMSNPQFIKYAQLRIEERRRERSLQLLVRRGNNVSGGRRSLRGRSGAGGSDGSGGTSQVYRAFSLATCMFVFPDEIPRPFKFQMRRRILQRHDDLATEPGVGEGGDVALGLESLDQMYRKDLQEAVQRIRVETPHVLSMEYDLSQYSPKFYELLQRLDKDPQMSLVYTRLRQAEGVALLTAAMDTNGWSELRLVRDPNSSFWLCGKLQPDATKCYIVLRTEEDPECNRLLLHIFNNELSSLPRITLESLTATFADDRTSATGADVTNVRGEMARAIIITASGAEGISLKNVRQVHMLESFWNHNRLDQVIGRALRAKSHSALPPEERHVSVYLYLTSFSDGQREDRLIMNDDKGLTSDQYIHGIALKKKQLTDQVLSLVKAASVDCRVHADTDSEVEACFHLPKNLPPDSVYRTSLFHEDLDDRMYARQTSRLVVIMLDGKKFFMDNESGNLYDYEKLHAANELVWVGKI